MKLGSNLKIIIRAALLGLSIVFLFSVSHINMAMGQDGQTISSDCPFMPGVSSPYHMDPLGHVAACQSMFSAIQNKQDMLAILLLLLLSFGAGFLLMRSVTYPLSFPHYFPPLIRRRARTYINNPLRELFSSGILHPKIL